MSGCPFCADDQCTCPVRELGEQIDTMPARLAAAEAFLRELADEEAAP